MEGEQSYGQQVMETHVEQGGRHRYNLFINIESFDLEPFASALRQLVGETRAEVLNTHPIEGYVFLDKSIPNAGIIDRTFGPLVVKK